MRGQQFISDNRIYMVLGIVFALVLTNVLSGSDKRVETEELSDLTNLATMIDPILSIPAIVKRPNAHLLKPYSRLQRGLKVKYLGNIFSSNQPDLIWVPDQLADRVRLTWQSLNHNGRKNGLVGIAPGEVLELVDNELYDFNVGTLFVKVRKEGTDVLGYTLYETIIGDCDPVGNDLWVARQQDRLIERATDRFQNLTLYPGNSGTDNKTVEGFVTAFNDPSSYQRSLSGGEKYSGVHPVYAANAAYTVLLEAIKYAEADPRRSILVKAVEKFFQEWVIPSAVITGEGIVSWPYQFEWHMNWGIKLGPPWYSAYASARFAVCAALLFRLTEDSGYEGLARKAALYVGTPIENGGAQYDISGFKLPAEYVYATPPLPNVRVLDGEMIAITALFDTARLLGDSRLLEIFIVQASSLAMQLPSYARGDGNLEFSMYIEDLPDSYRWDVWSHLQVLANQLKEKRYSSTAVNFAKHVPLKWREQNGF